MKWKGDVISFEVYGTSHAPEVGVRAKGLPAVSLDGERLARFMERRKAKNSVYSTKRIEADAPEITVGGEFCAIIKNSNVRSGDYSELFGIPRPSHADYAAHLMDGRLDFSGGGEFSGRLTAPLCALGFAAKELLAKKGVRVSAWVRSIGKAQGASYESGLTEEMLSAGEKGIWAPEGEKEMLEEVERAAVEKDSIGGEIQCAATGLPGAIGGGVFGSLEGKIASLCYLIPAVKGVSFGKGFALSEMRGSEANDPLRVVGGEIRVVKNDAGGINGGLSNGNPVTLSVAFRPTPSIGKAQNSVDLLTKTDRTIEIKGRHDACIVPRAVPVVESAVAIALLDALLASERAKCENRAGDLDALRKQIDEVDKELCALLSRRFDVVRAIGEVKKEKGLPVLNEAREKAVLEKVRARAEKADEADAFAAVYQTIMTEAKKLEK